MVLETSPEQGSWRINSDLGKDAIYLGKVVVRAREFCCLMGSCLHFHSFNRHLPRTYSALESVFRPRDIWRTYILLSWCWHSSVGELLTHAMLPSPIVLTGSQWALELIGWRGYYNSSNTEWPQMARQLVIQLFLLVLTACHFPGANLQGWHF